MPIPERLPTANERAAIALGKRIVALWLGWSDENEVQTELDMREAFKEVEAQDMSGVDCALSSALRYFAADFLREENPQDLTFGEMVEQIEEALGAQI